MIRSIFKTPHRCFSITRKALKPSPIQMPALSPTMESGRIVEWNVGPGDAFDEGDILCTVETDKASVAFETLDAGIISKILHPEGSNLKVGELIAVMVDEGEEWENAQIDPSWGLSEAMITEEQAPTAFSAAATTTSSTPTSITNSTSKSADLHDQVPSVRLLAIQHGIDLNNVKGTGPKGITKGDMLEYLANGGVVGSIQQDIKAVASVSEPVKEIQKPAGVAPPVPAVAQVSSGSAPAPATPGSYNDVEITQMRNIIASRLTESKTTIPHQYTSVACEMSNIMNLRKSLKEQGIKVSVNDFIIKASAMALKKNPNVNQVVAGNSSANVSETVDISVAVATDSGLITPIVKDANVLGLSGISSTVLDLATRAKNRKLKPEEFMGGSFTISNLGMFGISHFSAVINPPQVCIMAVGGSKQKILPTERNLEAASQETVDPDFKYDIGSFMTVQLSSDARFVSQEDCAEFLASFKANMENPVNMIV